MIKYLNAKIIDDELDKAVDLLVRYFSQIV